MKILIVTELFDELRPCTSFIFEKIDVESIITSFKSKANGLHSFLSFKTDHIIINKLPHHKYKVDRVYNNINTRNNILKHTKNIYNLNTVDFTNYDIIWCRDDILLNINELQDKYPNILFVYENVEHAFSTNNYNYDLILDHTNFSFQLPERLHTSISFPYVCSKEVLRQNFNLQKIYDIYFDSRDIKNYSNIFKKSLTETYNGLKIRFKNYKIKIISNIFRPELSFNPDQNLNYDTSTKTYLQKIASSKYFVLTFPRLGQSLVEAAALKCIVIGTRKSINSPFICHKECLFNDFASFEQIKNKILYLESKPDLQKEILEYQDKMLTKHYYEHQKNVLETALEIKRHKN